MAAILFMGIYIYDELPAGIRQAKMEDLFFGITPRAGMWFMVGPYNEEKFVAYRLRQYHTHSDLRQDIEAGRVYVLG